MKTLLFSALFAAVTIGGISTAEAKSKKHKWRHHDDRQRTIYVIERNRPVARTVYYGPSGYYRVIDGRRSYIRERYYETYPSDYYYRDGRRRAGVSITF